jgi:hypothetical protein
MGLTESKKKELHDKKFDDLYAKHKADWQKMATDACAFAKQHISKGVDPLGDDILKFLLPMLEVNDTLRKHQEDKHAKYRRYRESFGEYIVEEHLNTLPKGKP